MSVRVRFAPSPTGEIHIGNLRTALFNYLFARQQGGSFILRIEDTDQQRSTGEFEDIIHRELGWLGLEADEGPISGGEVGPYHQLARLDIYKEYLAKLLDRGLAYKCYCTAEELETMREAQRERGEAPGYNGKCRELTTAEQEKLEAEGRQPVIRFKTPETEREIIVADLIHGQVSFSSDQLDDFIIFKSDGTPTYNFAVVVDDYLMEISHVIRGEDHLSNTPKQILIYNAFDWQLPEFAHLPMILGSDRSKLSKRSGEDYVYVSEYRNKGYLPEAMFNFLSLLGWSPSDEEELLTKEEIIERFSLARVNKSAAVFDVEKLNWMNGVYIREADLDKIVELAVPYLEATYDISDKSRAWLELLVVTVRDSLSYLAEITEEVELFFTDLEYEDREQAVAKFQTDQVDLVLATLKDRLATADDFGPQNLRKIMNQVIDELPVGGRLFFKPVRLALSGTTSGPELYNLAALLGQEESIQRLEKALTIAREET